MSHDRNVIGTCYLNVSTAVIMTSERGELNGSGSCTCYLIETNKVKRIGNV